VTEAHGSAHKLHKNRTFRGTKQDRSPWHLSIIHKQSPNLRLDVVHKRLFSEIRRSGPWPEILDSSTGSHSWSGWRDDRPSTKR